MNKILACVYIKLGQIAHIKYTWYLGVIRKNIDILISILETRVIFSIFVYFISNIIGWTCRNNSA